MYLALTSINICMTRVNTFNFKDSRGFSLLELVVVLTIFLIVISVTINIFISMVTNQRRALEEQELLNQTSFAFEYISSALSSAVEDPTGDCLGASGRIYLLPNCPITDQACNRIKFINASDNNACQEFFLDDDPVNPHLMETKNGAPAQNLLSNKLIIKYGRFIINGNKAGHYASSSDSFQPRVTFLLDVLTQSNRSEKIIQNTIVQ